MNYKVSIIICTYNRAPFLKRTLNSLKNLEYKNFEVVVINGPSTDETERIIYPYRNSIKILNNPKTNLSISRNMGIKASAGDIVAFIDDDAIPDRKWLNDILSLYTEPSIGGVGGRVYGPGDDHFQFENGYVDFWGESDGHYFEQNFNDPQGSKYNMMLGTNCTFRRDAIVSIGGFDEYYDYFHDESDACLRMVRAGYKILNHPRAYIHHEFAQSHIRQSTFDGCRLNWYPIIKNKVYFAWKNSDGFASEKEKETKANEIRDTHLELYRQWEKDKKITSKEALMFSESCKNGYQQGLTDGKNAQRLFNYCLNNTMPFLQFDPGKVERILKVCLLCKDNIFDAIGGTAKYTYELAKGMSQQGHEIHVISCGDEENDWLQDGISMHSVKDGSYIELPQLKDFPSTNQNLQYSYRVYKKIIELNEKYSIDMIESVLWNFEGAVAARLLHGNIPVIVRLQTPLLKVVETQNWQLTDDLRVFSDFEAQMLKDASHIIAISEHIKDTISNLYPVTFSEANTSTVYLGVDKNTAQSTRSDGSIRILFVGRLERRKGIHTIFEALPRIMNQYSNVEMRFIGNYDITDSVLNDSFYHYFYKTYGDEAWADRVYFLGQVSNKEKEQEFSDCDIFIAPSLYESFGIILIEAMSAMKPVIGCRVGGMQEIVEDNETGYLIQPENSHELIERLETLISKPELRKSMGEKGYERFENSFSNDAMTRNTLKVYAKESHYINHSK